METLFVLLFLLCALVHSRTSQRSNIESFKVMDVMARAMSLESEGVDVIHLEVGQPSTGAPSMVIHQAKCSLDDDKLGYTHVRPNLVVIWSFTSRILTYDKALGISKLRARIAAHYLSAYGVHVDENRIIVTTGSSAAFLLSFLGLFDPEDSGDIIYLYSSA